jgi:CHASE2 domain-containing sensor protein
MNLSRGIYLKAGFLAASICLTILFSVFKVFNNYELLTYDLRFKLRPAQQVSSDIAIIEISDDTLKNLGVWPLPRDFHATLTEVLKYCGAKAVVFDIIFSESTALDPDFSSAIKSAGNVYLPLVFDQAPGTKLLAGITKLLAENAHGIGHINVAMDRDGKIRTVPLYIHYQNNFIPQMGFKAACDALGLDTRSIVFQKSRIIVGNKLSIPVIRGSLFPVNYPGKWVSSFKHFSYFEILKSYSQKTEGKPPDLDLSELKNKICFIGLTAAGTSDFQPVPLENNYPLVGLQASIANSILRNNFICPASASLNVFIALLVFILSLLVCLKLTPVKAMLGSVLLSCAYFVVAVALFAFKGFWLDLFLPLLVIFAVYVALTVYRFLEETRKRQLLEQELGIAHAIQQSFLPEALTEFGGLAIASKMLPAKFVGGDLYDLIALDDNKLGVLIGDVAGKGVSAALIMAQTISLFRIFGRFSNSGAVVNAVNKELYGRTSSRFVTCMYFIVDTAASRVSVCSAGHAPLLLYHKKTASLEEVELDAGMPLGIDEAAKYGQVEFDLEPGDRIIVFTDGISEARNTGKEEFGVERLKKVISDGAKGEVSALSEAIITRVKRFSLHCVQHDDITLIVIGK